MRKIIPVILAGGTGSRLWPLSRESFPKQFLKLTDEDHYTLLQETYKRIEDIENLTNLIVSPVITSPKNISDLLGPIYSYKEHVYRRKLKQNF